MKKTIGNPRQLVWAGIVGPLLFVAVFTIEGWLRPNYDPLATFVSALSLGPRGWVQIVNFIVFGCLLLMFTRTASATFQSGKASRGGITLLTIIVVCYLLSGPFIMDPVGTPRSAMTIHGTLLGIFGGVVFSLMPISCFVFLRRFREDAQWQHLRWWTFALGTICATGAILLTAATKTPDTQNIFTEWLGLIQRAAIVPFMRWLFIFAFGLLKINNPD